MKNDPTRWPDNYNCRVTYTPRYDPKTGLTRISEKYDNGKAFWTPTGRSQSRRRRLNRRKGAHRSRFCY
jgi:hypothetical protein